MFGKSASYITDYLITSDEFNADTCVSLLPKSLKKKANTIIESIDGYQMTQAQKDRMILVRSHRQSAIIIISEIGTDMTQFASSKRLCCWAGLTPGNNESVGKKKSVRITRAGVCLKPALVQVAHAAVTSNSSPYYKNKYERILKRRGKKRAIIAIARMILTAVFHMLSTGEIFNPCDLYKIDMQQDMKDKQKEKAVINACKLLTSLGMIITSSQSQ